MVNLYLWWNEKARLWLIGLKENIGSTKGKVFIHDSKNSRNPTLAKGQWKGYVNEKWTDINIECSFKVIISNS